MFACHFRTRKGDLLRLEDDLRERKWISLSLFERKWSSCWSTVWTGWSKHIRLLGMTCVVIKILVAPKGEGGRQVRQCLYPPLVMRHIFRIPRLTNFKLGVHMEDDEPHQPQAPWPQRSRSQGHVISLSRLATTLSPVSLEAGGGIPCRPNPAASQSINQKRIRVTKITNVTARPLLQC